MAKPDTQDPLAEFGLVDRTPPDLFRLSADIASAPINGYTHVLRRAWKSFDKLIGVLSVGGRPTVYFQSQAEDGRITLKEQQRFWNNGVAPILVRVTPQEVRVYSSLRPPALNEDEVDKDKRLVDVFKGTVRALESRDFVRSVEVGTVYDRYRDNFDPSQAVDQRLVQNLRAARELLSRGRNAPDLPTIHRLLGRIIFTCYLEARRALLKRDFGRLGAGATATFQQILSLPDPVHVRKALAGLFRRLRRYFRGNLFESDLEDDLDSLRDDDVVTLDNLIKGTGLATGQTVLPFYVYDFGVIPIETISAVYEDFIRAEDSKAQKTQGAYYTPPKLVEFTTDLATEPNPDLSGKRVLDPACGSGAFLVSLFNRMAEGWVRQNERARNGTRAEALAKILRGQIRGVDRSLVACQATCLSLYMAMLDFLEPPEIRRLGPQRLPNLLINDGEKLRHNGGQTVICGDFLSSLPALEGKEFDLIVGNPPWISRGNVEKNSLAMWKARHPAADFPIPAGQVACAFLWDIPRYLKPNGRACLLMPAKILLGDQADSFQVKWFAKHRVETVAQLSDLRFFLFPGAIHPTVAICFALDAPIRNHRVAYLTPKASRMSLHDNALSFEPDDRRVLALTDILSSAAKDEAAVLWLSYNWASPRDRKFLSRLRELPPLDDLAGEPDEGKRWIKGQGFQPHGADEGVTQAFWQPCHLFLDAKRRFDFVLSENDTMPIGSQYPSPHRIRDQRVFKAPLVIFNKGFSKVAFAPFDVLFRDCYQSISGPEPDRELLMFLAATLLSPLARYFLFHLSSMSFYRTPYLNEVLRLPFPLQHDAPGDDPAKAVRTVAKIFDRLDRDRRFSTLEDEDVIAVMEDEMTKHVYSYYDVNSDEKILIEDTVNTLQPSATPSSSSNVPTLAVPRSTDRQRYAETLIDTLRAWAGNGGCGLGARCVVSDKAGLAVITIAKARNGTRYGETKASSDLEQVLSRLKEISPDRYRSLVYLRNIAVLDNDRMHIVKPLTMRFWLRSAALNDADSVASHLLDRRRKTVKA